MTNTQATDAAFYREKGRYLYNLALRMLWHPADAEDAVQDILLKVHRGLPSFRGQSSIDTWIYRIAVNHLLNIKARRFDPRGLTFDTFQEDIDQRIPDGGHATLAEGEQQRAEAELKAGCTLALLQCLDADHRMVFILDEIFGLDGDTGAAAVDIRAATYRKRLSRARSKVRSFLTASCGWLNPEARCHCRRRLPYAIHQGRVRLDAFLFSSHGAKSLDEMVASMNQLDEVATLYRSTPYFEIPDALDRVIKEICPAILDAP